MNTSTNATANTAAAERLQRLWQFHEADPDNTALLRDIAQQAIAARANDDALKALNTLLSKGQSTANDEAAALFVLTRMGQLQEAIDRGLAACSQWPEDEALQLETARAQVHARQFEAALQTLPTQAHDEHVAQMAAELALQAHWHLGQIAQALEVALPWCTRWPDNPRLLALTSALLFDEERAQEAFAAAQRAYALGGSQQAYHSLHVLASQSLLQDQAPAAFAYLGEAQTIRQDDGRIWLVRGSAHMAQGQLPQAKEALLKAQTLFPNHPGTHLTLAWLYLVQKELDQAQVATQQAIAASPAFAESHGTLATILAMKGQTAEAQQAIRRATLLDANCFSAKYAQAVLDGLPAERIEALFKRVMVRAGRGR